MIDVRFEHLDVARALDLEERVSKGFEALWVVDRLRSVMQSPEGRAAVEFFDNARRLWREQVGEAVRDGERTVTLRFEVPEAIADAAVVVGRNIVQMLANGAGGVEPLPPDHVAQAVALVEHAQDEVTRYRASRSV